VIKESFVEMRNLLMGDDELDLIDIMDAADKVVKVSPYSRKYLGILILFTYFHIMLYNDATYYFLLGTRHESWHPPQG